MGCILSYLHYNNNNGTSRSSIYVQSSAGAYYEAAGWRAYYERRWLRLLQLIVSLCQEQFGIPFPTSLLAAWAPLNHNETVVGSCYTSIQTESEKSNP